jgi:hypothetical protein
MKGNGHVLRSREIAAQGPPFELEDVQALITAGSDPAFSPLIDARDGEIEAVLDRVFGHPWRLRRAAAQADYVPRTPAERFAHADLARADLLRLRPMRAQWAARARDHDSLVGLDRLIEARVAVIENAK